MAPCLPTPAKIQWASRLLPSQGCNRAPSIFPSAGWCQRRLVRRLGLSPLPSCKKAPKLPPWYYWRPYESLDFYPHSAVLRHFSSPCEVVSEEILIESWDFHYWPVIVRPPPWQGQWGLCGALELPVPAVCNKCTPGLLPSLVLVRLCSPPHPPPEWYH